MTRRARPVWIFALLLLGMLAVSVAGNLLLLWRLGGAFGELHSTRIFPLGFVPATDQSVQPETRAALAIYGDSRAYQWGKFLRHRSALVVKNLAHGSISSSQLRLQLLSQPVRRSEIALVQVGINDLHPLGALKQTKPTIIAQLHRNLPMILELLLARSDKVVLTTVFPPANVPLDRHLFWDDDTLSLIREVNQLINSMASERVIVMDTGSTLARDSELIRSEYEDPDFFLHVNEQGYRALSTALNRLLEDTWHQGLQLQKKK